MCLQNQDFPLCVFVRTSLPRLSGRDLKSLQSNVLADSRDYNLHRLPPKGLKAPLSKFHHSNSYSAIQNYVRIQ